MNPLVVNRAQYRATKEAQIKGARHANVLTSSQMGSLSAFGSRRKRALFDNIG